MTAVQCFCARLVPGAVFARRQVRCAAGADQAAVENNRLQLAYCTLASPVNTCAGRLLVKAGNVVDNNDTLLVVLRQSRAISVDFAEPEQELPCIREHAAAARLRVDVCGAGLIWHQHLRCCGRDASDRSIFDPAIASLSV